MQKQRTVTTLQLDVEIYNRIASIREHVSEELRFNGRSLGLAPMLGLLVDYWQQNPPSREWLEERAKLYPKRGRPPKQIKGTKIGLVDRGMLGHEVFWKKEHQGTPYKILYCKRCSMIWNTWDGEKPGARCPGDGITVSMYSPKVWTKNELLLEGFEADEVEWATT